LVARLLSVSVSSSSHYEVIRAEEFPGSVTWG
jgi:hypothetical protein